MMLIANSRGNKNEKNLEKTCWYYMSMSFDIRMLLAMVLFYETDSNRTDTITDG